MVSAREVLEMHVEKLAFSIAEACQATTLSRATLARAIKRKQLGSIKRGRRRLIPDAELRAFMEKDNHAHCAHEAGSQTQVDLR